MLTVKPFLVKRAVLAGVQATLFSLVQVSAGTPRFSLLYGIPATGAASAYLLAEDLEISV